VDRPASILHTVCPQQTAGLLLLRQACLRTAWQRRFHDTHHWSGALRAATPNPPPCGQCLSLTHHVATAVPVVPTAYTPPHKHTHSWQCAAL
jgi:hypothetical protein